MGQLYKGNQLIMESGVGYCAGTGIEINNDTISNTGVTSVNGCSGAVCVQGGVDIHELTEKSGVSKNDELVIADSSDSYENKKIKLSSIFDILGDGSDGSCVIENDTVMCAKEYNFENFMVCNGATLRFCGNGIPIIRAKCCIDNQGTIDLKSRDLSSTRVELIFGVGCTKSVATVPLSMNITECGGAGGLGDTNRGGGPGESGYSGTGSRDCPGGAGATCAGGGGGGQGSTSASASAGCAATACCGGAGGSGRYAGGGGYGYLRGGDGGSTTYSGAAGAGGNSYCCGGNGGNGTNGRTSSGGNGGDAWYYGGNGGNGCCEASGGNGGAGYYCKGGNGGSSQYGPGGKGGDSYWGCGGNGGDGGGGDYNNNGGDGGYGYILGGNGGASRSQYAGANRSGGRGGDSRLQGGNGGCGSGGKAIGGRGGDSKMGMYGIVLMGCDVISCCITGCGGNGGNGGTGTCGAGGGGNGGDGGSVMIVYTNNVSSGCIENSGGKGGCTGGTSTVSGANGKDGDISIIHFNKG